MKIRDYRAPLTVLATGVVGFSMFCIVSAAAMAGPSVGSTPIDLQPQDLVDSAVSNINTVAALTVESIVEFIPTATISPSNTSTETDLPTNTAVIPTRTRFFPSPTRTRDHSDSDPPNTPTRRPTRTFTPIPSTNTVPPTATDTPVPSNTPVPPTPADTDTPVPPTSTDEPPTSVPPTSTNEPPTPEPPTTAPQETLASTAGAESTAVDADNPSGQRFMRRSLRN